jgi:quercetin dioxygenase-like cupin family protein
MLYPELFDAFPRLVLPFPEDVVQTRAIRSEAGLVVFLTFPKDLDLPLHRHRPQCGTVVAGRIDFTIGGETRTCGPGESYTIPADVDHAARIHAGTRVIDVFAEPDRYPLRS